MWSVTWKCSSGGQDHIEQWLDVERCPVTFPPNPPNCPYCDRAMTLARVEDLRERVYTEKRTRRKKGGFGAVQLPLFGKPE